MRRPIGPTDAQMEEFCEEQERKLMRPKPLAQFDLDGTMADWDGAMRRDLDAMRMPSEPELPADLDPHSKLWKPRCDIVKGQIGWWKDLTPLPDGFKLFAMAKAIGFKIQVLTKGPKKYPMAWAEKVMWCAKHMPGIGVNIVMNKEDHYGRVLVDDYPYYVKSWLERRPRGVVIMPNRRWNQGYSHPRCIRYIENQNDQQVRDVLQMAYDRPGSMENK